MSDPNYAAILAAHIKIPPEGEPGRLAAIVRDLQRQLSADGIDQAAAATRKAADELQELAIGLRASGSNHEDWVATALAMGALRTANVAMWRADTDASLERQREVLRAKANGNR